MTRAQRKAARLTDLCECGHWRLSHKRVLGCLVVLVGRRPGMCTCPGFRMKEPAHESETGGAAMKVVDLRQAAWDIVGASALWSVYLVVLAIDAAACAGGWVVTKLQHPAERREGGDT